MKEKIKARVEKLAADIKTLQEQKQTLIAGIKKMQKAAQEAELTILVNQSKINELNEFIKEEPKVVEELKAAGKKKK